MADEVIIQPYYQKMRRRKKKEEGDEVAPPVQVTGVAKVQDVLKKKSRTA